MGVNNKIADALSRLRGVISKKGHSPDDNMRPLTMSKRAEEYRKHFEIQDPLIQRLGEMGNGWC